MRTEWEEIEFISTEFKRLMHTGDINAKAAFDLAIAIAELHGQLRYRYKPIKSPIAGE